MKFSIIIFVLSVILCIKVWQNEAKEMKKDKDEDKDDKKKRPACPSGEVYGCHKSLCEGNCERRKLRSVCKILNCITEECLCDFNNGYVRHYGEMKCIKLRDCPADSRRFL